MLPLRFSPAAVLMAVALLAAVSLSAALHLATVTPRLGLVLAPSPETGVPTIVAVDPDGPAAALAAPERPLQVAAIGGVALAAGDLVEDPDQFETYAAIDGFLARQSDLAAALHQETIALDLRRDGAPLRIEVRPVRARLADLPGRFWMQVFAAVGSLAVGGWVLALRRSDRAARIFALSSFGLFTAIMAAAVYSSREIALDGSVFRILSALNHLGAICSNAALVALFLSYPRRIVGLRTLGAGAFVALCWLAIDVAHAMPSPVFGMHVFLMAMLVLMIVSLAVQWRATRRDPAERAAARWIGTCVLFGAGAYSALISVPLLHGAEPFMSQAHTFLFLMMIYAGIAVGIGRYRLFELGEWCFRIGFYSGAVALLVALDAILVFALQFDPAPSLGIALLAVGFAYLPARDLLWRRLIVRRTLADDELFRRIVEAALAPSPSDRSARWRDLLRALFDPLHMEDVAGGSRDPEIRADGLELLVPGTTHAPSLLLKFPWGGRGLFGPSHIRLVRQVTTLAQTVEDGRAAYERGVEEERRRIAQDLHDDVGARLLSGLNKPDLDQTRQTLRAALADLKTAIRGLAGEERPLGDVLADLRHETAERLAGAGVDLDWPPFEDERAEAAMLPYRLYGNLISAVREAISNTLRHAAASRVTVDVRRSGADLVVTIADDGVGLRASARGTSTGLGLGTLTRRLAAAGGRFSMPETERGTLLRFDLPLPGPLPGNADSDPAPRIEHSLRSLFPNAAFERNSPEPP
ncbi:sensor histidine kinase [Methylobrevis pamukkalensis]|uniref:histidine kinase n=1 Tax=Methylobrevis pamukkalensis TaxID=1439726 RepID=A0A1E3H2B3_9HYPH|nr:ATP-binding protein [Methylobrevis pamukkalensis]ODN70468.1 Sensor histidine kinase DesK [Methylobrevis pamukkalensis]